MNVMVVKALIPPNRAEPSSDKIETSTYGEKYMNLIRKFTMIVSKRVSTEQTLTNKSL